MNTIREPSPDFSAAGIVVGLIVDEVIHEKIGDDSLSDFIRKKVYDVFGVE